MSSNTECLTIKYCFVNKREERQEGCNAKSSVEYPCGRPKAPSPKREDKSNVCVVIGSVYKYFYQQKHVLMS